MRNRKEWMKVWDRGVAELWSEDFIKAIQADVVTSAVAEVYKGNAEKYDIGVCDEIALRIAALMPKAE